MEDFRAVVLENGNIAAKIIGDYLSGNVEGNDKVKTAERAVDQGVKISNRNQFNEQMKRSQAIRLVQFIPKNQRHEYISLTNPEVAPFLLPKPVMSKKK